MRSGDDIPVRRNGTNRRNRPLPFLDTDLIKIDDRTPEDFLDLTRKIAKGIYFDDPAMPQRKDNWEDFFTGELGQEQAHQPHYALFLAFLELFQLSIDNLNTFTKRHLDFFYQKVLQFAKEPEVADKVHVVLALAKNIEEQVLLKGTRFLAGEDASGQLLQYELLRDTVFSQAKLAAVKQLYVQKETRDLLKSEIDPEETLPLDVVKGFYGETVYEDTGEALDQMLPWYPFVNEDVPAVEMGWAVASPLLILHEGSREITFTITGDFTGEDALLIDFNASLLTPGSTGLAGLLKLSFSTAQGWLDADIAPDAKIAGGIGQEAVTLRFRCKIPVDAPAISACDPDIEGMAFNSPWPIAKITLDQDQERFPYSLLRTIKLTTVQLNVQVKDIKGLVLSNDQSRVDPNRPFIPFIPFSSFGSQGVKDASFYIGNAEVFQKSIHQLVIDLDWHNPPEPKVAQQFKASIHRLHKGVWQPLTEPKAAIALFDAQASKTRKVAIVHDAKESDAADTIVSTRLRENRNIDLQEIEDFDIASQDGFIKFVLGRNPTVGADQPYVPTLAGIRLGYAAEHVIHHDESIDRVLHIHPFGWTPYQPDIEDQSYLLPRYDGEGMLYLAFKDVVPPREVSILFQVIEGSADPDVSLPEIEWSYLSDDRWVTFADIQILEDSTNQFNRSGIVTLRLPAVDPGTGKLFSPDYYWVRAKTMTNANGACLVRDIRTQAATLLFVAPPDGAPRKLPLEANSIKEMAVAQAEVDAVNQPYPSFDGKPKEKDDQFYLRICERLRHKDRAVTLWDYERLVLEKFPSLYEAQCFKHFNPEDGYSPGSILMVVIADIRHHAQRDPFKPTTSLDRLDQVKRYLENVCPPYLRIEVKNPVFEEIRLSFLVKFKGEANPGYYQQQLNQAIQHHLSPWAFDEVGEIKFGSTVYKSALLHFVEEQPYVDIVTYFDMDHADANGNLKVNVEEATATTPISILVSAKSHHITVIQDQSVICAEGIGFMIIEQTFKVRGIRDTFISIEEGIGYMKLEDDFKIIADNKT